MGAVWSECCAYIPCVWGNYETVGGEEENEERGVVTDDDAWMEKELLSDLERTRELWKSISQDPAFMDTLDDETLQDVKEYALRKLEKDMDTLKELQKQEQLVRQTMASHYALTSYATPQLSQRLAVVAPILNQRLDKLTRSLEQLRLHIAPQMTAAEYIKEELARRLPEQAYQEEEEEEEEEDEEVHPQVKTD